MDFKKHVLFNLALFLLVLSSIGTSSVLVKGAYVSSSTIFIYSNADFASASFPGSGTEADPYVIENLNITTADAYGIYIQSTTVYFVIKDCYIRASSNGIYISNVGANTVKIVNNTIEDASTGICLRYADGGQVYNNKLNGGTTGIYLVSSNNINATNNLVRDAVSYGIRTYNLNFFNCSDNVLINTGFKMSSNSLSRYAGYIISNNSINDKQFLFMYNSQDTVIDNALYAQVFLLGCDNITITNQNLTTSSIGLYAYYSSNIQISNSLFSNQVNALLIEYSDNIIISNVTATDFTEAIISIYYSTNISILNSTLSHAHNAISTRGVSYLTVANSNIFELENYGVNIYLSNYFNVTNSNFQDVKIAIHIQTSSYVNVTGNNIINGSIGGLDITYSSNVRAIGNTFTNCSVRILDYNTDFSYYFEDNTVNGLPLGFFENYHDVTINDVYGQIIINNSTNIIVADQTMAKLTSGLIVYNSKNMYLHNITIVNATLEAIGIMNSENISLHDITVLGNDILDLGLRAYNVIFLELNHSYLSSTKDTAFYLEECANITISYNIFDHGGDYGLYLYDCSNATVFGNDFFHSTYDLISDESGNNNLYYHPIQKFGNCYDDWNGSDSYRIGSYPDAIFDLYPINDTDGDSLNDSLEVYHHLTDPFLADTDKDGLQDNEEISNHHTDPTKDDTDSDGMPDGWEIDNNLNPIVDDSAVDTDNDGLTNLEEFETGTNPQNNDTDGDGMSDGWEINNSLDPTVNDSGSDEDNDGLTNLEEFEAGTNPQNNDTDSDGMPDGWEIDHNLNPTIDDSADDADNDGLTNLEEYNHGTNPHLADTDGDGYTDNEEIIAGTDPLNSQEFPEEEPGNIGIVIGISIGASILIVGIAIFLIKKKVLLSKNKRK